MKLNKVLFYGQGNGRDHANHIAIAKCKNIEFCSLICNENALMQREENVYVVKDINEAVKFAENFNPDLVIISNRKDLSEGATEIFREAGFRVFGITKDVSRLETEKEYAKDFMKRHNINTPHYYVAENKDEAIKFIKENWEKTKRGYVLKVEQLSKNSFARTAVPANQKEAIKELHRLYETTKNARIIIEEKINGYELSLHVLINNGKYSILPFVQDYKKKYSNNEGPMTAGMASVAQSTPYSSKLLEKLRKHIVNPTIKGFEEEGIEYNYILYIGVMVTDEGEPYVLEYNTRTGNPEWLALLGLLKKPYNELIETFYNNIEKVKSFWKNNSYSVAIYGISAGYPEYERKNFCEEITGFCSLSKDIDIIGEYITENNGKFYPNGGRVFAIRRVGNDFEKIRGKLIKDFQQIHMNGMYFRDDIKELTISNNE